MKYLLYLLLFTSLCGAQEYKNYTKVTVCRIANSDETGPCSIEYYAKKLKRTGHYIQAMESFSDTLAYNLLKLKADAQNWPKEACNCGEEADTIAKKPLVPNMFIVEVNSYKDTIFTTPDNKALFLPKEQARYIAPDKQIASVFTKEVTDFFKRDFASEINAWKMDSIPAKSITLKNKSFYGLTRKEFEEQVAYFDIVTTDSLYGPKGMRTRVIKSYYLNTTKFSFDGPAGELTEIIIETNTSSRAGMFANSINLDGVVAGDPEEMLCNKYDNSTLLKNWDAPLSALNNYYTYEVYLDNLEGLIRYSLRNKTIQGIYIEFKYPNGPVKKKKAKK